LPIVFLFPYDYSFATPSINEEGGWLIEADRNNEFKEKTKQTISFIFNNNNSSEISSSAN